MKKLLMATDLSARSDRALQRAIALAAQHGAALEIVNVIDDTLPHSVIDRHEEAARSAIEAQVRALPHAKDVVLATRIIRGQDYIAILRRAEEFGADLIVLGIHRHSTRPLFRGTTAERVIRLGRLPVLVVREPVVHPYTRVLVGVDLSLHSRRALELSAELAPNAEFRLAHAADVPFKGLLDGEAVWQMTQDEEMALKRVMEKNLHEFAAPLAQIARRWEIVAKEGSPQDVIEAQAQDFKPDLIAIGTHGRTGIANAMLGSVAEDLLSDAPTDVLAVKAW